MQMQGQVVHALILVLEGERKGVVNSENELTGTKTDALGASGSVEDAVNCPTNLQDASERRHGRSEQKVEEDSPGEA